jgi:pimeloyl-ACP methyl ester carboxylesterase/DNA-binding winged helix-turn-helix (wHTH) protein
MRFHFGDYTLDADRRELRCGGALVPVEPQVFDLLLHVIRNRDHVVSKDDLLAAVWHGRIVSESTLGHRINAARRAIGDSGENQKLIRTIARRGIRFVGDVHEDVSGGERAAAVIAPSDASRPHPASYAARAQEVTFCRTSDGVHLAVACCGNGLALVKATNWLNHIEYDWQSPVWRPLFDRLADPFRLIRYDGRGIGLSDWDVTEFSFESFARDLETVVDSLGVERFALLGISGGAALAVAYATRRPDRVSRLVLSGGYPQGWLRRGSAVEIAQMEALITLIRHGWGQDNPAFRQVFTSQFVPGGTPEEVQWFNDLQRISISPENAIRLMRMTGEIDVVDLLPRIAVPTLVLHSRRDARVPFEQGLILARGIPNARFVALESDNHLILSHEPAWQRYIDEICNFLNESRPTR